MKDSEYLMQLKEAYGEFGFELPSELEELISNNQIGIEDNSPLEPWHLCGLYEVDLISKRWPKMKLENDLFPFARHQGMDQLACFVINEKRIRGVREIHYDLGNPRFVDITSEYEGIRDWFDSALRENKDWLQEISDRKV